MIDKTKRPFMVKDNDRAQSGFLSVASQGGQLDCDEWLRSINHAIEKFPITTD